MNLIYPIAKTAIRFNGLTYAESNMDHGSIKRIHSIGADECGFLNTNNDWLTRKEAFVVAIYHDQLKREAYKFLAKRLMLDYDLTNNHPGLDSMWLKKIK